MNFLDGYGHPFWWKVCALWWKRDKFPPKFLSRLALGKKGLAEAQEISFKVDELIKNMETDMELEIKAMGYIIKTLSVRKIYDYYQRNANFRRIFDAWCEQYGIQ